jgi:hypothetical protein
MKNMEHERSGDAPEVCRYAKRFGPAGRMPAFFLHSHPWTVGPNSNSTLFPLQLVYFATSPGAHSSR